MANGTDGELIIARDVDDEPASGNQRSLTGFSHHFVFWYCVAYTSWHLLVLNVFPLETWAFRTLHVAGGLGIGFLVATHAVPRLERPGGGLPEQLLRPLRLVAAVLVAVALLAMLAPFGLRELAGLPNPPPWVYTIGAPALLAGTGLAMLLAWLTPADTSRIDPADWTMAAAAVAVALYLLFNLQGLQFRAGVMPTRPDFWVTLAGVALILECTRRLAGLALVVISMAFILYAFVGPWLPGFLAHSGYSADRFFTYLYTDNGILGPTTAVSSTYIILFICFAAFLQASKVGDYFVNFAFAAAGHARGGPAKVAVFASGLMGMINGTSAGNVVATGSLTIPLMKRVGYRARSAAGIEAAASTGGQIMPPIMGAGAFIMAEVTGIRYTEIAVAALIPATLYFISIYFMVDLEAQRTGMKGLPRDQLPRFDVLAKQAYLFVPIVILIAALFMGYSVIRAGTLSLVAAVVVSWLTPHRLGPVGIVKALNLTATMAVQLIAVCACAGIIVGVIGLTGVGLRFSAMLLTVADTSQFLALLFAMGISLMLGMGMPTTAAYAVAASVVAPGLIRLGIEPLIAHFFVFYFAVISAITPPVALAAYAGAAIAGSRALETSLTAFKLGLAAFIVPFMFFYSPALLMMDTWPAIIQSLATACVGVFMLSAAVQGWFFGRTSILLRLVIGAAALLMIEGGLVTDLVGIGLGGAVFLWQRKMAIKEPDLPIAETAREPVG
ncbi:MAG: TRAP transporter permease [Geminicoccaceae bacterium]|nr:TRAP transporter permease [Geminicoccaceae bacterium]